MNGSKEISVLPCLIDLSEKLNVEVRSPLSAICSYGAPRLLICNNANEINISKGRVVLIVIANKYDTFIYKNNASDIYN